MRSDTPRAWADGLLSVTWALPTDSALDAFECGDAEVDNYFRRRTWFDQQKQQAAPPTYEFRTEPSGLVVGYAAVGFRNTNHPHDNSALRARYLMIYVVGVNLRFQGEKNPRAPEETFAATMLRFLKNQAEAKADCAGLCLWVRANNARAIRFYEKMGFVADPGGPVQRDQGAPHLTMRTLLDRSQAVLL